MNNICRICGCEIKDNELKSLMTDVRTLQQYYMHANPVICTKVLRAELARRDEVISRLKETLPTLKISHNYCDDCWYSCPKAEGGCCNDAEGEHCNCGADKHNAIIDALMRELE